MNNDEEVDDVIEFVTDHTGTDNLELNYTSITYDYELIYEYVPYYEYD